MDWDPADIVAALHKAGWSLRRLSFAHGYRSDALKHALRRPYPRAERIIAEALGREPRELWPSRHGGGDAGGPAVTNGPPSGPCPHGDSGQDTTPGE
ncbi:MAG: transcriptional regulator [Thiohalorhabdus sp.]|uniref:helix-turn-helix domain-containing protein n=1 Tax=Thiohalorhabdus sp. TaxID=3094134 RepID=UPI0039808B6C